MKIGIVGAGIVGRLLAWEWCQRLDSNLQISLFSEEPMTTEQSCSVVAAGMLCPLSEGLLLAPEDDALALHSLQRWPLILQSLGQSVFYHTQGTYVIAHPSHQNLLSHFLQTVQSRRPGLSLALLKPAIHSLMGCFIPEGAAVDVIQLLRALGEYLIQQKVVFHEKSHVTEISAARITTQQQSYCFDKVYDCRGMGAKNSVANLRGVRGERILCHAPGVTLHSNIRLLHPRTPCYLVPRGNQHYIIGATTIESEDQAPIRVQSVLDLLSAAVSIEPGFFEASIIDMKTACRPTLDHASPMIENNQGVTVINGFSRHGFLLAPAYIEQWMSNES